MLIRHITLIVLCVLVSSCIGCSVARFHYENDIYWGIVESTVGQEDSILILEGSQHYSSTSEFLMNGGSETAIGICFERSTHLRNRIWETVDLDQIEILSPITPQSRVVSFTNGNHTLFKKDPSSFGEPFGILHTPPFIQLLDLQVDIGFIVGVLPKTDDNDKSTNPYVQGIVLISNFFSDDIQLLDGHPENSHTLPKFTRFGPYLELIRPEDSLYEILSSLSFKFTASKSSKKMRLISDVKDAIKTAKIQMFMNPQDLIPGSILEVPLTIPQVPFVLQFSESIVHKSIYRFLHSYYYSFMDAMQYLEPGMNIRLSSISPDCKYNLGEQRIEIVQDSIQNWNHLKELFIPSNVFTELATSPILWISIITVIFLLYFIC